MKSKNIFYVYMFLREHDSETAKAGTPYYVGKGMGKRAYEKRGRPCSPPTNRDNIVIVSENLTEADAFLLEKTLIVQHGRKNNGGILHNKTDGGEGVSNPSAETRVKIGSGNRGRKRTPEQIKKNSEFRKGKPLKISTKEKMSAVRKGRKCSPEHAAAIARSNKNGKWSSKKVIVDGVEYDSVKDAATALSISTSCFQSRQKRGIINVTYVGETEEETLKRRNSYKNRIVKLTKKPVLVDGVKYESIFDATRAHGVSYHTWRRNIKNGKIKVEYL